MRAALATTRITPTLPVYLAGYGDRKSPAAAVHEDLEALLLLLDDGETRACLVTCDLLALSRDFSDPIREAVALAIGTTPDRVLTSCTHVHSGPSTLTGTDAIGWPVPSGYRETLVARIGGAAANLVDELAPVDTAFTTVQLPAGLAMNRRGHALAPEAQVLVLDPVALVGNFGIHPTITGPSNLSVATDWVGPFRRAVERVTGTPAVFLQGCQGDVNPAVTEWEDGAPAAWAPVVAAFAEPLAAAVADARDHAEPVACAPIRGTTRTIDVPVGATLLAQLAGRATTRAIELVEWQLGDVEVRAIPGEGFHGLEQTLRADMRDPMLLAGLAPDWHGYFPVPFTDGYEEGLSFGAGAVDELVAALTAVS
jgi:hypothetical protein